MKREGPIALLVVVGLLYIVSVMFASSGLEPVQKTLDDWYNVVAGFITFVGVISLTQVHGRHVVRQHGGWIYSAILLVVLYGYIIIGLAGGPKGEAFNLIYNNILTPILMTIFSTLTFWIGSAAYRAFRAKTFDSAILLAAAIIVMIGRVTLGAAISPALPKAAGWIVSVPTLAGMRAIEMGAAIGGIVLALRMITGLERNFMGSD
ncbi:MAG: hypothetical protein ACOX5M_04805 [Bacillota bacterium]